MINRYGLSLSLITVAVVVFACVALPAMVRANENKSETVQKPGQAQSIESPIISLDKNAFDFGKVEEGFAVSHSFTVKNNGSGKLTMDVHASCGCTTPKLSKKELQPGESAILDVTIDTAMKQDAVVKDVTIDSNDPEQPKLVLSLSMVVENPHRGMGESGGTKIFNDKHCASCHVARGEGKLGRELYNADCAMCHGPKAEGAVGPALFGPYGNADYAAFMKGVLEAGSTKHRSMPGFLDVHGGPLDQKQVDSILQYLNGISKARGI